MGALLTEINRLPVEERLELVIQVLDGIPEDKIPVPEFHKDLIAERLAAYRANPSDAQPWEDVMKELENEE